MGEPSHSHKVSSLLTDQQSADRIRDKYEEIYRNSDVWLYKKSHGVHSIIYSLIKDELPGKSVLDIGCGAGRLAIMCAYLADKTTAFDFSEAAIEIASLNATCSGQKIDFSVSDIETFCATSSQKFDVISLVGVLEHVSDPVKTLQDIDKITNPGGKLIVSCPNFINARGYSYMTLLNLLHLPMSLADLRQVDFMYMEDWCNTTCFAIKEVVGAIYRFAWDEKAANDMIKRVPLASRDAKLSLSLDFDAYNQWQKRMVMPSRMLLEWLEEQGVLQRIKRGVEIQLERRVPIQDDLWEKIEQYMHEDIESDPYCSNVPPFCYMGGEGIYVLQKVK